MTRRIAVLPVAWLALLVGLGEIRAGSAIESAADTLPVISIFNLHDGDSFTGGQKKIIYNIHAPSGIAVDRVDVMVDGQPVGAPRGVERADEIAGPPGSIAGQVLVSRELRDQASRRPAFLLSKW